MDQSQLTVNGRVRLALFCGNVIVEGRVSETEVRLMAFAVSTFSSKHLSALR